MRGIQGISWRTRLVLIRASKIITKSPFNWNVTLKLDEIVRDEWKQQKGQVCLGAELQTFNHENESNIKSRKSK
jgi:hypothetical protein